MTKRRPLALGAAATIGFGSLFFATPALAEESTDIPKNTETSEVQEAEAPATAPAETPEEAGSESETSDPTEAEKPAGSEAPADDEKAEEPATVPESIPEETRSALEEEDIVAFGTNAAGTPVVVIETTDEATAAEAEANPGAFTEVKELLDTELTPEIVAVPSAPQAWAEGDVVAGAGYAGFSGDMAYACSIGFTAWSPEREPAVLSAGHCGYDQDKAAITDTVLTIPSEEPAVGGDGYGFTDPLVLFGEFSFAQFGAPGNAPGSNGDTTATDVSVIDVNPTGGWNLLPEITDWTTAGDNLDSLSDSTTLVKRVGSPTATSVSKSGRTTGKTTGTISSSDILDGWSMIEDRWVRGFSSNVPAAPGDSGGSVFQGTKAVGLISGGVAPADNGGVQWTWSTSLVHALPFTDGYEVALDIDEPVVTSPANNGHVQPGAEITGTVPSNATELGISTAPNSGESIPVSGGAFSLTAPTEPGTYTYSLTATNGMSRSETVEHTVVVDKLALAAPVVNDVATDDSNVTVTGTGAAGAEVTVVIDGETVGTATVGEDGTWSLDVVLEIGEHEVSATQALDDQVSPAGTGSAIVHPVAPEITSIGEGSSFAAAKSPSKISGTGIDGATISLTLGTEAFSATVENGEWTVDFGGALAAGEYSAVAVQTVNDVNSATTSVNFSVLAAPAGPGAPTTPGNDGNLATTGGAPLMPLGIAAFAMLLVGGAVTLVMARRKKSTEV